MFTGEIKSVVEGCCKIVAVGGLYCPHTTKEERGRERG